MQFSLSSVTGGQTRILAVPDANTTIVGTDVAQTLTNKTIIDNYSNIMAVGVYGYMEYIYLSSS